MGFNNTSTALTLTAKLTPIGRQRLVSTNNALIKTFSLGDSDANYHTNLTLASGQVPNSSGSIGVNNSISNGTTQPISLKSTLIVNATGITRKPVSSQSINILTEKIYLGQTTLSSTGLTQNVVNRNDITTDPLVNLLYSFSLPLNSNDDSIFTGVTYSSGGYSDTAFSGIATEKILVIGINENNYGEMIDGKSINVKITTSANTFNIYSTYQGNLTPAATLDVLDYDTHEPQTEFGQNVVMLFSDEILKPNGGNPSLSWSTGYNTNKPFTLNGKRTFNLQTNNNLGTVADKPVGIAYLDKGFIVITDKTIVDSFNPMTSLSGTEVSLNSSSTNVFQSVTCIADRGEFGSTTNPTFEGDDLPRISEIGLYDEAGNLIAIAKSDRHITKNINEFLAMGIKIIL
jgi:hypothetical protein